MPKTIDAIYEDGVLKPLQKIKLKRHQKIKIAIFPNEEEAPKIVESQKKALLKLSGIGKSGLPDLGNGHDKYLY